MKHIYVLKCTKNKYYIGKSSNPNIRLKAHNNKKGARWTRLFTNWKLVTTFKSDAFCEEDRLTFEYMNRYGIDNVRGGCFSRPILSSAERNVITRLLRSGSDTCFNCGKKGHFSCN